jgi:hypothetical protein
VRQWGIDKGITGPNGKGTLLGQLWKTQEELTETRDAAIKWMIAKGNGNTLRYQDAMMDQLIDGLGDTVVTIILAAEMAGLRIEDCLDAAYREIANRKGKMVNGQFIKEVSHE